MRSRWNLPIYIAYLGVCMTALGFIVMQMGVTLPWSHPYRVTATFRDAAGILANNQVLMNGTKIGRIDTVSAVNGQAQVDMVVEASAGLPIYKDASAMVRIKNLLGETYVEVNRGTASSGTMPDGGSIPVAHTLTPVQIDEVLAVLDPQSRQRLQLLIDGAGDALARQGSNLNSQANIVKNLVTSLNGPAAVLKVRQGQLEDIVLELQRFYDMLAKQRDTVRQEFGTWAQVMAQEAAQETAIKGTITQADTLLQHLDTLVTGEVPNIRALFDNLPTTLTALSSFLGQSNQILTPLVKTDVLKAVDAIFLNLGTSFADTDPSTAQKGPYNPSNQQHLWSVYSVNCGGDCTGKKTASVGGLSAPNSTWQAALGGGG
ncbi:MAG TPA: MlaD family protein [Candidatus Dormibacteraeota bacterium]|jgi:virulence factor Mce-like protein|nr:MlaD family protein [Candidatus Dormibacteraeota bacterium]